MGSFNVLQDYIGVNLEFCLKYCYHFIGDEHPPYELDRPFFTLREYHTKRDYISGRYGIRLSRFRSGFVSLLYKGFVTKGALGYSLNWGLQKYIHRRTIVGYAIAAKSILRAY